MRKVLVFVCVASVLVSCGTTNVQQKKIREIRKENRKTGKGTTAVYTSVEDAEKERQKQALEDVNVIYSREPVFIPVDTQTKKPLTRDQVVKESMNEAIVTPSNFIGGTQFYDYNEHKQYPVVTKVLGLSVVQLEEGEVPIGVPFLSDTTRWEVTGDVWRIEDGRNIQLVMLKPLEAGLTTNMVLVTNKRIYQFVLSSTRDSYMPMVKFRYPMDRAAFATMQTIREDALKKEQASGEYYLSYNYKIKGGWAISGWFKPDWMPLEAWDDGHKTYIKLPRGVLQREYPTVFEEATYIVNYRVNENVMILDKLVRRATLKLNRKRVIVWKMRGEAEDLRRFVKQEAQVTGDKPSVQGGVRFDVEGDVPWVPVKVMEYDGETHIIFNEGVFNDGVLYIIDENRNSVEYRQVGNVIIIQKIIRKVQLAYNNQQLYITRR